MIALSIVCKFNFIVYGGMKKKNLSMRIGLILVALWMKSKMSNLKWLIKFKSELWFCSRFKSYGTTGLIFWNQILNECLNPIQYRRGQNACSDFIIDSITGLPMVCKFKFIRPGLRKKNRSLYASFNFGCPSKYKIIHFQMAINQIWASKFCFYFYIQICWG